jgi:hypothetical protein
MAVRDFTDCSRHDYRSCPWRDDVVEWFRRHPLASHCSCVACRALTGRLEPEPDEPAVERDPRGELW